MSDEFMPHPLEDENYLQGSMDANTLKESMEMLVSKENIETKTEIPNPLMLAIWESIADSMETKGLVQSSAIMHTITQKLLVYMVSKNRKGRGELLEMSKNVAGYDAQQRMGMMDKLMGRGMR